MTSTEPRAILLDLAQGNIVRRAKLETAIATLEQQPKLEFTLATLAGTWQLLWTSGTRNVRKLQFNRDSDEIHVNQRDRIIQRFDAEQKRLENEVYFPMGSLCVAGSCDYTDRKRLHFTFSQLSLKLGALPTLSLPFGSWATGWLQTTYLDAEYHIERGDRGGISIYRRLKP
jgi:hypothetical protein